MIGSVYFRYHRCGILEQEAEVAAEDLNRLVMSCQTRYQQFIEATSSLESIVSRLERFISGLDNVGGPDRYEVTETVNKRREMLLTKVAELSVEVIDNITRYLIFCLSLFSS